MSGPSQELPPNREQDLPELKTILIAEDEGFNTDLFSRVYSSFCPGVIIVTAKNGQEALQYIVENGLPDLIHTDFEMPVMSGDRLLQRLREMAQEGSRLPHICLISGNLSKFRETLTPEDRIFWEVEGLSQLAKPITNLFEDFGSQVLLARKKKAANMAAQP